jgi:hypothetical protein
MSARDIFEELAAGKWPSVQEWIRTERTESLHLEFKSRDEVVRPDDKLTSQDEDDIARTISGFAIVEGGVLVIGLRTNNSRGKRDPDKVDADSARQDSAYLVDAGAYARAVRQRMRALTDPPVGIREVLAIVDPDDGKRGVVVVLVPDSEAKPHRTMRGLSANRAERYYERSHTITDVMSHSMLAALFGGSPPPRLRLVLRWEDATVHGANPQIRSWLRNDGRGVAEKPGVRIDHNGATTPKPVLHAAQGFSPASTSVGQELVIVRPASLDASMPPGFEGVLCPFVANHYGGRRARFRVTIFASNMQPIEINEEVDFISDQTIRVLPFEPEE